MKAILILMGAVCGAMAIWSIALSVRDFQAGSYSFSLAMAACAGLNVFTRGLNVRNALKW